MSWIPLASDKRPGKVWIPHAAEIGGPIKTVYAVDW